MEAKNSISNLFTSFTVRLPEKLNKDMHMNQYGFISSIWALWATAVSSTVKGS